MTDWTAGYVADINYTFGYYQEMNPLRARFALLNNGLVCPDIKNACELGFGQGVSANYHAAAMKAKWYGTDFNPAQAGLACDMSLASGSGAELGDQSFEEFCNRKDLPDFDFIALHGIWSWISDENRRFIVDFVTRKLKLGGILYVSYNTLPGWAAFAPMRHLMTLHTEVIGSAGKGRASDIDAAIKFAEELLKTNPLYARTNPVVQNRMEQIAKKDRHYLAHEYFNKDWHPMHFATLEEWLKPAKLQFAGSAHFLDQIYNVNMTNEQQRFIGEIPNRSLQQSVIDFMINQQFRRDYWIKGARPLTALERAEALQKENVVLVTHRPDVSLKVTGAQGEPKMNEEIYNKVLDVMEDHSPNTIGELQTKLKDLNLAQIMEVILVLSSKGNICLAQGESDARDSKPKTDKLNDYLMRRARSSAEIATLVSPVTAGGIPVSQVHQLFLLALKQGRAKPEEWAESAWSLLSLQGQKLVREGKTIESDEENLAMLKKNAKDFEQKRLPILKSLLIA